LDAAVRQQVETVLIANLESDDPELFKLAAEVKLKRRLKSLQRIDEKIEIDQTFISCAEYQLFLDEMRAKKEFYQPDHWTTFYFPKGSALQPIVGVRAEDAEKFCEWLSEREDKKYRCPTLTEAQEFPAIDNHALATWCRFQRRLQWYSPEIEKSIELKINELFIHSWIKKYINSKIFTLCFSLHTRSFGHIFDFCHDIVLDLDNVLTNNHLFRMLSQTLARTFDHKIALNRISALEELLEFQQNNVSLESDILAVQQLLQNLQPTGEFELFKSIFLMKLLEELSVIFSTNNYFERQQAWYRCIAYSAKYSAILDEVLEKAVNKSKNNKPSWWQLLSLRCYEIRYAIFEKVGAEPWWKQILFWRKEKVSHIEKNVSLYAWAKIVEARQKGELPVWEGIRIVRERDV